LEEGKPSDNYIKSVRHVQLCPVDVDKLGIKENDSVTITTIHGSVTVDWKVDKNLDSGLVFFPYGLWSNQVYGSGTSSTGMPLMKGINATVKSGKSKVNSLNEIVETLKRGS
jgi:formylmethanofuran dehydrogenase subunit D